MSQPIKVLVWDENTAHHEKVYVDGIRVVIAAALNSLGEGQIEATTAHMDEDEQGLSTDRLENADVLIWWGHIRHDEVRDDIVARIKTAVYENGLGLILLHSSQYSRPLKEVLGGSGHLKGGWRAIPGLEPEEITVCAPRHPIAEGVDDFVLEKEEMYGAPFDVPPYQTLIFQSYFPHGGEYFPCGFATTVGKGIDPEFTSGHGGGQNQGEGAGRVFFFRPGHESAPTFFHPTVQQILHNAVLWCARRT